MSDETTVGQTVMSDLRKVHTIRKQAGKPKLHVGLPVVIEAKVATVQQQTIINARQVPVVEVRRVIGN